MHQRQPSDSGGERREMNQPAERSRGTQTHRDRGSLRVYRDIKLTSTSYSFEREMLHKLRAASPEMEDLSMHSDLTTKGPAFRVMIRSDSLSLFFYSYNFTMANGNIAWKVVVQPHPRTVSDSPDGDCDPDDSCCDN
jgi:hypothetical protein